MEFHISQKDWKKVIDYAQASYDQFSAEIGGFMIAKKNKDGDYVISNPEILKQEVTGGTTEMEKEAVADYYVKASMKHGSDVRFVWWHSHANMSAFWSGTDTNTMKEYKSGDWSAFLVVNIRGEYKFRVCVWNPIEAHEDIDLNILGAKARKVPKTVTDSVSKLCSKPTYTTPKRINTWTKEDDRQVSLYNNGFVYGGYGRYDGNGAYGYDYNKITIETKDDDSMLTSTVDHVDNICSLYTEGQFTFKDWLLEVKKWNKILKKKDRNFNIIEVTENELHEKCGYYTGYDPMDLVNLEDKNEQNIEV